MKLFCQHFIIRTQLLLVCLTTVCDFFCKHNERMFCFLSNQSNFRYRKLNPINNWHWNPPISPRGSQKYIFFNLLIFKQSKSLVSRHTLICPCQTKHRNNELLYFLLCHRWSSVLPCPSWARSYTSFAFPRKRRTPRTRSGRSSGCSCSRSRSSEGWPPINSWTSRTWIIKVNLHFIKS